MNTIKKNAFGLVSVTFLVAILVCLVCDYLIKGKLSWSLIVILSLMASWLLLIPLLKAKDKVIQKLLINVSVIAIPFLAGLSIVLKLPLIFKLGLCITIVSIAAIWSIYGIFIKYHRRIFIAIGLIFIISIPLALGITHITAYFIEEVHTDFGSDIFHTAVSLILAGICFVVDYFRYRSNNYSKEMP